MIINFNVFEMLFRANWKNLKRALRKAMYDGHGPLEELFHPINGQ